MKFLAAIILFNVICFLAGCAFAVWQMHRKFEIREKPMTEKEFQELRKEIDKICKQ